MIDLLCQFQFHYGTIKRNAYARYIWEKHKFQFHYGTIKRKQTILYKNIELLHFNSTMGRLKGDKNR